MAEDMLIKNFGKYLEEWKQMLANDPTMKHEDARQQIMKQRQKFEHASRRGRIGLSKHLRETIDASSIAGFSALLGLYEELLEKNVYRKTGLPTLETWIETYDNASYNRKHGVINELRSKISVLMTEPSPTESTDSK
jgi:hypothetical protein